MLVHSIDGAYNIDLLGDFKVETITPELQEEIITFMSEGYVLKAQCPTNMLFTWKQVERLRDANQTVETKNVILSLHKTKEEAEQRREELLTAASSI